MVDRDLFIEWCEGSFGRFKTSGDEIQVNSIFTDDYKFKLYCNTTKNLYHCFKTGAKGTLHQLVAKIEKCSMEMSYGIIGGKPQIANLDERLREVMYGKNPEPIIEEKANHEIEFPNDTYRFNLVPSWCKFTEKAKSYLTSRKLNFGNFYFCVKGKYANRIIIPWFDENDAMYYWNARTIFENVFPKYKLPSENVSEILKSNVIWMSDWSSEKIYLTEGEIDAMSLSQCSFAAAAIAGKELTDGQATLLAKRQIVVTLDNDEYGISSSIKTAKKLLDHGFKNIRYIRPPVGFKDWNELYVKHDKETVQNYIFKNESDLDLFKLELLQIR